MEPSELPDDWRDKWRKAGPQYDRHEDWRDVAREALRFGWWYETRIVLVGMAAVIAIGVIVAVIVAIVS